MKEVILSKEIIPTTNLEGVSNSRFYGVTNNRYGVVGFISKSRFFSKDFKICSLERFSLGNSFVVLSGTGLSTLQEYIKYLLDIGCRVFEFDKLSELALWLEETKS